MYVYFFSFQASHWEKFALHLPQIHLLFAIRIFFINYYILSRPKIYVPHCKLLYFNILL